MKCELKMAAVQALNAALTMMKSEIKQMQTEKKLNIPFSISLAITQNLAALEPYIKTLSELFPILPPEIEEARLQIVFKYAAKDEAGQPKVIDYINGQTGYEIPKESMDAFQAEIDQYMLDNKSALDSYAAQKDAFEAHRQTLVEVELMAINTFSLEQSGIIVPIDYVQALIPILVS